MKEQRDDLKVDGRVAQLIAEAALAGAYSTLIAKFPQTAAGFGKMRELHSAKVAALASEIAENARRKTGEALKAVPPTARQ